jgi:hypothetical protein
MISCAATSGRWRRRVGIRDREGVHQRYHVTGIERQEADAFRAQFYVQVRSGGAETAACWIRMRPSGESSMRRHSKS